MMVFKFVKFITCFILACLQFGLTQTNLKIDTQFRYRHEMVNKNFNSEIGSNNLNLLRTRVGVSYKPISILSGYIQFQDSRITGEENSTMDGSADYLDLHQAFFLVDSIFSIPLSLKLGRFEHNLANERLIGAVGWHNIGRSFDGFSLFYQTELGPLSLFNYKIREALQPKNENDLNLMGATINLNLSNKIEADFFGLRRKEYGFEGLDEFTLGSYLFGSFGDLRGTLELAYQIGRLDSLKDVSAYLFSLNLNYVFAKNKIKPSFIVGLDYLSGDDDLTDRDSKVFNTLYATNHKFYGIMDYFLNILHDTYGAGLTDLYLGGSVRPSIKSQVILTYHKFNASKKLPLSASESDKSFGNEIDLILNLKYNQYISLQAGGAVFFPGKIFEMLKGADNSTFFYLAATVNM
jgi:hypothetical protein